MVNRVGAVVDACTVWPPIHRAVDHDAVHGRVDVGMLEVQFSATQVSIRGNHLGLGTHHLTIRNFFLGSHRLEVRIRGLHCRLRGFQTVHGLIVGRLLCIIVGLGADARFDHGQFLIQQPLGFDQLALRPVLRRDVVGDVQLRAGDVKIRRLDRYVSAQDPGLRTFQSCLVLVHLGLERRRVDLGDLLTLLDERIEVRVQFQHVA